MSSTLNPAATAAKLRRVGRIAGRQTSGWRKIVILSAANILVSAVTAWSSRDVRSGDHNTYLGLAEGLRHGVYSWWSFLPDPPPDTFRTPGYPVFLFVVQALSTRVSLIQAVQVAMYWVSVALALYVCWKLTHSATVLATFLLLLLPCLQFGYYSALVFPEITMVFLVMCSVALEVRSPKGDWRQSVLLGLVWGTATMVRPIFLLYPVARLVAGFIFERWRGRALMAGCVAAATAALPGIPYVLWNHANHGVWSFTPIESGAPNAYLGFWHHRLPGYRSNRYWKGTYMGHELWPLVDQARVPEYIVEYSKEWDEIERRAEPYLTKADRARQPIMSQNGDLFDTYSTGYTLARAALIRDVLLKHIWDEPGYYVKTRIYTLLRLWVTGIDRSRLERAHSATDFARAVIPTLITSVLFLGGLICVAAMFASGRMDLKAHAALVSPLLYYWLIHAPISIQSRYTVPVHLPALILVARALTQWTEPQLATTADTRPALASRQPPAV